MSLLLSRLKDFGDHAPVAPVLEADTFASGIGDMMDFAAEPPVDIEAERAAAYAEGEAAGSAAMRAKYEADIATIAEVHEREIAELRYRFQEETAALIADRMTAAAQAIAELVSDGTAKALVPVLGELLTERAVADLAALIRQSITEGAAATITVTGPTAMFEQLKAALPEGADLFKHQEGDEADLSVDIDGSVVVTRLSAWADSIRKVMA